tara:strand:+ start:1160 stop:1744 length:585 start_codon:yes stop_codon:yes gene_type:complete
MKLNRTAFLLYKLFNSSFTGLSIGILFIIYKPIEDPSVYSLGGIFLAISMLLIALFYEKLLNIKSFYFISLLVEIVMFLTLVVFFIFKISYFSALLIYSLYQLTFIFGGYLVRAETLVAKEKDFLSRIDVAKQIGYLIGLSISYLFYKVLEHFYSITDGVQQIEILHYVLIFLQTSIICFLFFSFQFSQKNKES